MTETTNLQIYTDGSHKNRYGAWAFIIVRDGSIVLEKSSRVTQTSSNQMEFQAAIEALKVLLEGTTATFYSDSRILIDTMTLWSADWKANGWVKKNGRPIPYVEQIIELNTLSEKHNLTWKWVRSHAGITFNERCDELCTRQVTS